jgi:type II secretory pathway component PulC
MLVALLLLAASAPPPDLALVGLVLSPSAGRSLALVRAQGRTRVVGAGESAFGGRVVGLDPSGVTLAFGDERVVLRLSSGTSPESLPPLPPPREAPAPPADPGLTLPRQQLEARLGVEIPRILAETTLVPFFEDGRITGLTLQRMPAGTLLTEAGLLQGDVIREINGTVIDGMGTLIGLWTRLRNETSLRAVVEREGRQRILTLTLK